MDCVVQNPSHNIRIRGWSDVQRAIAEDYQVNSGTTLVTELACQ